MKDIYKICFKKYSRVFRAVLSSRYQPLSLHQPLKQGDIVFVKTKDGIELGFIVTIEKSSVEMKLPENIMQITKKANQKDINNFYKIKYKEKKALKTARERIKEHNLAMAVVDVKYVYDLNKTIFYFCAPNRVDFRELVRDLAKRIRTKIELWQIGVKDAAKKIGGFGICGMQTCCSRFLTQFSPISIKMAKIQDIAIAPSNVSGPCGRLLCCLKYESDFYETERQKMPMVYEIVEYEKKKWKVLERNIPAGTIKITAQESGEVGTQIIQASEVKRIAPLKDEVLEELYSELPAELRHIEDNSIDTVGDKAE